MIFVTIRTEKGSCRTKGTEKETLPEILGKQGIFLRADCGGNGSCGRCRVRFLRGASYPDRQEQEIFTREELEAGWRLACRTRLKEDCEILIEGGELEAADGTAREEDLEKDIPARPHGIAVDLGTTNIVMQLVDLGDGSVRETYRAANRQGIYGADVISRIKASGEGKKEELKRIAKAGLLEGIRVLTKGHARKVSRISIGANTAMVHLLMGYSCRTLGVHPFRPLNLGPVRMGYQELFGDNRQNAEVWIFPGISAFLGGDLVAGLYALEFEKKEGPVMLADLGTNGELALSFRGKILAASAAAGPAFAGGGIEQGSEALDLIWNLRKQGRMDETGRLKEPYFFFFFLLPFGRRYGQRDIRNLQLAKAAIRAGMETLVLEAGIRAGDLEEVYLAGAFGCGTDVQKAAEIGLLPAVCADRIRIAGNSCLSGAVKYLLDPQAAMTAEAVVRASREIPLCASRKFSDLYMEHMGFES